MTADQYKKLVHELPCVVHWLFLQEKVYGVTGHHLESIRDALSHFAMIPVCHEHHQGPNGIHGLSRRGFELRYKLTEIDLMAGTIQLLMNRDEKKGAPTRR